MNFKDIYYEPVYGKLSEITDKGTLEIYDHSTERGTIRHMFIKRSLPVEIDPDQNYSDIISPYGYGGPLILEVNGNVEDLVAEFNDSFTRYCRDNKIISEFVRFHPILQNQKGFEKMYETIYMRNTVATYLDHVEDPFTQQFSKGTRKNIRKAIDAGVVTSVTENPQDLSTFVEIYYNTMDRNQANDYYYFPEKYFSFLEEEMSQYLINVNAYYDEVCIASGIYFAYDEIMQIHLSGTRREYLHLSPAYLLRHEAIKWAKEKGIKVVHHGGGTTNDPKDTLLAFKKQFSKDDLLDFYIGKKIYNQEVYDEMVPKSGKASSDFFPAYRGM